MTPSDGDLAEDNKIGPVTKSLLHRAHALRSGVIGKGQIKYIVLDRLKQTVG